MNILVTMPTQRVEFATFFLPETLERLRKMGNVTLNESDKDFTHEQMCEKIKDVDILLTGWGTICVDEEILKHANKLKYIACTGGSVANTACEEVYKSGIKILSGNEYFAESVAEGVMAYMLSALRRIPQNTHNVGFKKGWRDANIPIADGLLDKTVGIVSYGAISKYLIPMLAPFHVKIKLYSRKALPQEFLDKYNIEQVSLEDLFKTSDVVTIQTARNPHTIDMINEKHLSLMKDGALFINTSRGEIVKEQALLDEIKKGRIHFILDVYHQEPLPPDSPLRGHDHVLLMPHMGGPTVDRRGILTQELLDNIENHMQNNAPMRLEVPWEIACTMTDHNLSAKNMQKK